MSGKEKRTGLKKTSRKQSYFAGPYYIVFACVVVLAHVREDEGQKWVEVNTGDIKPGLPNPQNKKEQNLATRSFKNCHILENQFQKNKPKKIK